jgi:selenocysteine lyase/cysteine desulfurase
MFSAEKQRREFPAFEKYVYLDHATTGLIPSYSLKAMNEHLSRRNEQGIDGAEFWGIWERADNIRALIGKMINCSAGEVVYGSSSTQLFNIFANGIALETGDNVVTTDTTYPADAYIWLNKQAQGIDLRFAKTNKGFVTVDEIFSLVDERTRAVSICLVDNKTGFRHDIAEIGRRCRERGIFTIVDATQAVNAINVDVKALNVDFVTSSVYKWLLSPLGQAFAYIDREFLPRLFQSQVGWVGTVDRSKNDARHLFLSDEARRFESGGISFTSLFGLEKVVERCLEIGGDEIETYIMSLVSYVYERAGQLKRFKIFGGYAPENRSSIVSFEIPFGMSVTDEMMKGYGLRTRTMGGSILRTGYHYMNTREDVDRLFEVLLELEK